MPKITVTAVLTTANNIPAMSGRKQLILCNTGANPVYYGWEANLAGGGNNQGVPLNPGATIAFAGRDLDISDELRLVCAAGQTTTVNFTQRA